MPLYEYQCEECGQRTEVLQRVGAPPIGPCASCGGEMRRLVSAPAFRFKGSGWYVTDYARKGPGKDKGEPAAEMGESKGGDVTPSTPPAKAKDSGKGKGAATS